MCKCVFKKKEKDNYKYSGKVDDSEYEFQTEMQGVMVYVLGMGIVALFVLGIGSALYKLIF